MDIKHSKFGIDNTSPFFTSHFRVDVENVAGTTVLNNRGCCSVESPLMNDGALCFDQVLLLLKAANELTGKGPLSTVVMLIVLSRRLKRVDHLLILPKMLREFELSRTTAYRALVQLEALGLVSVNRHKGQGPLVSFVHPPVAEAAK